MSFLSRINFTQVVQKFSKRIINPISTSSNELQKAILSKREAAARLLRSENIKLQQLLGKLFSHSNLQGQAFLFRDLDWKKLKGGIPLEKIRSWVFSKQVTSNFFQLARRLENINIRPMHEENLRKLFLAATPSEQQGLVQIFQTLLSAKTVKPVTIESDFLEFSHFSHILYEGKNDTMAKLFLGLISCSGPQTYNDYHYWNNNLRSLREIATSPGGLKELESWVKNSSVKEAAQIFTQLCNQKKYVRGTIPNLYEQSVLTSQKISPNFKILEGDTSSQIFEAPEFIQGEAYCDLWYLGDDYVAEFTSNFVASQREWIRRSAYIFKDNIPWIDSVIPFCEGRAGIPLVVYAILRQMKLAGIKSGELKKYVIGNIENSQTLLVIARAYKEKIPFPVALLESPIYQLTRTTVELAGHRIKSFSVDAHLKNDLTALHIAERYIKDYHSTLTPSQVLDQFGLEANDPILQIFRLSCELESVI